MSTLFDRTIAESYTELLKTASASGVTSTLTVVEDGDATASALQISTSTVKSSGTLEVVGQAILSSSLSVTGASTLTGNVTMGGDLTVTGNAVIQGTLTANGGTLTLGDADTDNVVFNADVNSHILPNTDNTYDLGSASKSWRNLHLDGTATINNLSITGSQTVSATTQSTNKDTGALVVEGGVGVEKNVNVGGNLAVTGTTFLTGDTTITGDLAVNGGDLTTTSAAFNLVNANATSVNFAGAGTAISIGASTGTTTVNHSLTVAGGTGQSFIVNDGTASRFTVDSTNGNTSVSGTLGVTGATTLSSTLGVTGNSTLSGDLAVNGGDLTTSAATFNLVNTNATTVNAFGAGTAVNIGANTGTTTIRNNTQVDGTLGVTGNQTNTGNLTVNGNTTLGNANTDTTSFVSRIASSIEPSVDNAHDLGSSALEWKDLHLDGTAKIDTLTVDENATVAGTLGVTGAASLSSTLGVADTLSATKASGTGLAVTANATVGGDLTVSGNLTINGTTTNINTTNLVVEDKNVILGDVASPTDVTADGGGITLKGATDKTLNWVDATDAWTSSEHLNLVSTKEYRIAGNSVLSANTLGSGVTASSLTSVGTIGTGVWQGTIVDPTYGGTGVNNSGKTITLGGSLTTSGAHTTTLTTTGNTSVTLPTTGTLATLANAETLTNKTINLSNNTLQATSAQIATAVSDETGTGALVFGTSPTLTTPVISSIVNTGTLTLPTSTDTLVGRATTDTLTNKTISLANNTLQATSAEVAAAVTDETGTGSLVFSNSPTLVTPTLGAASATSLTLSNALSVANGGTGRTSMGGANTFLAVDSTNTGFTNKTLSAGTGINISDVANVVTITATGGGGGGGGGSASGAVAIYRYNATAGQTVFSGPDASSPSTTLTYTPNYISVYVNGVKLDDSDFTATNGTSVTLSTACVLNDDVDIVAFGAVPQLASPGLANYVVGTDSAGTALQYKQLVAGTGVSIAHGSGSVTISASGASPISAPLAAFRYIASNNQTVFSGVDTNGNTLAFTPGFLYVFVNGVLLAPTLDYTTTSTDTVTLTSGCSLSDFVDILAFGQVTSVGLTDASVTTAKVNDSAITTAKINDSAVTTAKINNGSVTTAKLDQTAGSEAVTTATIRDGAVTAAKLAAGAAVPSQTGNAGKYLTTNGSTASWGTAPTGFRNRIINGDMRIDQRNAGASITPTNTTPAYPVDRFRIDVPTNSKITAQQNSGSVTPPAGFTSYLGIVSTSSTVATTDYINLYQAIEGFNVSDLAFGSASAKQITLSFWARSSLTGTFGGFLANGAQTRTYLFTYSISSANTWEYKTITIAGDTSGTWLTNNGVGLWVGWSMGAGSTYTGTSGSWSGSTFYGATGQTNLIATNGATFYITGVQLEAGSTATDFERRPYGTELALCQRYYEVSTSAFSNTVFSGYTVSGNNYYAMGVFKVTKRANPTLTLTSTFANGFSNISGTIDAISPESFYEARLATSTANSGYFSSTFKASAEL